MTKTNWGAKRICPSCAARFYDLGKNPAKCPKCGTMHDITAPVKARRRTKAVAEKPKAKPKTKMVKEIEDVNLDEFEDIEAIDSDEEIEEIEEIEDIDSLEELEEAGDAGQKEKLDDEAVIEEEAAEAVLIDGVDEDESEMEEEEEEESKKPKRPTVVPKSKPAPKKKARK